MLSALSCIYRRLGASYKPTLVLAAVVNLKVARMIQIEFKLRLSIYYTCSSLIPSLSNTIRTSRKESLTAAIAMEMVHMERISRFHSSFHWQLKSIVHTTPAHIIVAQTCRSILLQLHEKTGAVKLAS